MTEEQLAIIRSILEDYKKLANIASDMCWAKTETKWVETDRMDLNAIASFISLRFEKGYVPEHFPEAVTQAMIASVTLSNECDADKEWQDDEQRRDKLNNYWGVPVWDFLEYKKVELIEVTFDYMKNYICENAAYDYELHKSGDYELPPEALSMLSDFDDVKLYEIGESLFSGCCVSGKSWIALKDDTFLWVEYSGMSD